MLDEEEKERVRGSEFIGFTGKMAVDGGKVDEMENPDDAAAENCGAGVALGSPYVRHVQLGSPVLIISALSSLGKKFGNMPFHTEGLSPVTRSFFIARLPFTESVLVATVELVLACIL